MGSEVQPQGDVGTYKPNTYKDYAWHIVGSLKSKNVPPPSLLEGSDNVLLLGTNTISCI